MTDHDVYQSPFSWRYGSGEMRRLWSEAVRRRTMRAVWLALAEAQHEAGLVSREQLDDLRRSADQIDIERATAIEATTRHDVMAEVLTWAEQAPVGGGVIHLGATSADITDNTDALRMREGLGLLRTRLVGAIGAAADTVEAHADRPTMGWTHLQPAAPTTVGYRLAVTLGDLVADLDLLDWVASRLVGKGFKGAVGTRASYAAVLGDAEMDAAALDERAMARLGLGAAPVTGQVVPRKQEWLVVTCLAGIGASAATFAFNLRLLQSPSFGEWFEGFAPGQVGSSAMPWKRNPVNAENVSSLARYLSSLPGIAWRNEEASLLERTLDDSANRRFVLPGAFLAADEILMRTRHLLDRFTVDEVAVARNLERFGPFAATEAVLMAASRAGGDRQALHARIRDHSMTAWKAVEEGRGNPLAELLATDPDIAALVDPTAVRAIVANPAAHVGDAPARAREAAAAARARVA